jgi:hypothetical protein
VFVDEIFDRLVAEQRIVSAKTKSGTGYRTDKKNVTKEICITIK